MKRKPPPPHEYDPEFRADVLEAVLAQGGTNLAEIARIFQIDVNTVRRWCVKEKIPLMTPSERMRLAGMEGCRTLWGNWEARRARARELRLAGANLATIRKELKYKSVSSASYACRSVTEETP